MRKSISINMEIDVPDNCTDKDIEEFITFQLDSGGLSSSNPLIDEEFQPDRNTLIIDVIN